MKYYRKPRVFNELRSYAQSLYNDLDIAIKIRGRRKANQLWIATYDIPRHANLRCWKHYRRHQWRAKPALTDTRVEDIVIE